MNPDSEEDKKELAELKQINPDAHRLLLIELGRGTPTPTPTPKPAPEAVPTPTQVNPLNAPGGAAVPEQKESLVSRTMQQGKGAAPPRPPGMSDIEYNQMVAKIEAQSGNTGNIAANGML